MAPRLLIGFVMMKNMTKGQKRTLTVSRETIRNQVLRDHNVKVGSDRTGVSARLNVS